MRRLSKSTAISHNRLECQDGPEGQGGAARNRRLALVPRRSRFRIPGRTEVTPQQAPAALILGYGFRGPMSPSFGSERDPCPLCYALGPSAAIPLAHLPETLQEDHRIHSSAIRHKLSVKLNFPSYREGIANSLL